MGTLRLSFAVGALVARLRRFRAGDGRLRIQPVISHSPQEAKWLEPPHVSSQHPRKPQSRPALRTSPSLRRGSLVAAGLEQSPRRAGDEYARQSLRLCGHCLSKGQMAGCFFNRPSRTRLASCYKADASAVRHLWLTVRAFALKACITGVCPASVSPYVGRTIGDGSTNRSRNHDCRRTFSPSM